MSCHLVVHESINRDDILIKANELLKSQFYISHSTIQIEGNQTEFHPDSNPCN